MNKKIYHQYVIDMILELNFFKDQLDRFGHDESCLNDMIFTKSDFEWSLYEKR